MLLAIRHINGDSNYPSSNLSFASKSTKTHRRVSIRGWHTSTPNYLQILVVESQIVWRAFFFAVGTMLVIVGVECLMIDSATIITDRPETRQVSGGWFQPPQTFQVGTRTIQPPDWIPWSFIASGTVVILYALTLPRRWGAKSE
jgi:hypothetical protein